MKQPNSVRILIVLLLLLVTISAWKGVRRFQFINNCNQTIWVGGMGLPQISNTGW